MRRARANAMAAAALAISCSACGVDRLGEDRARVMMMFELPDLPAGYAGAAPRDELDLFRLDLVGIFIGVRVTAPDMDELVVDWPDDPPSSIPTSADLDFLVDAGENRTFEVNLFVLGEDGEVDAFTGSQLVEELPGGQRIDVDIHLEDAGIVDVDASVDPAPGSASEVVALHPVDADLLVVYPQVPFTVEGGELLVDGARVAPGRDLGWALKLASGDWFLSSTVTEVP